MWRQGLLDMPRLAVLVALLMPWTGRAFVPIQQQQQPHSAVPAGRLRMSRVPLHAAAANTSPLNIAATAPFPANAALDAAMTASTGSPLHIAASPTKRVEVKFVTSNPLKTSEVRALLAEGGLQVPFDIVTLDIALPELQESPLVIAIEKTRLAADCVGGAVLCEDTSLIFNALGELPGPYIKHFLDQLGSEGLFKMVEAYEDRSAKAICNVGFSAGPHHQPLIFTGITYGEIVQPEEGDEGFGWDTCFRPSGFATTFSKMTVNEKNAISHRSLALRQFQQYIAENWREGGLEGEGIRT